jgi:glycolate oxidase iron-sulfur subunit
MRGLLEGDLSPDDPAVNEHLDRCLGCRGCESACPSGVPYGHLLEATRETLATYRPLPLAARAVLSVFKRPALLAVMLAFARFARATRLSALLATLPGRIGFPLAMLESTRPQFTHRPYRGTPADRTESVTLLTGCVMEGLYAATNRATERVLETNGYRVRVTKGQRCCGALHAHAGDAASARDLAHRNIEAFERSGADFIAVNAAGCGAMLKEYGDLLGDDPVWADRARAVSARVRDATELLAARGPRPGGPLPLTVTYDAPCHLLHAQRVVTAPLDVLKAIPGLELVPLADSDQCCGSAGIYNLVQPGVSSAVLQPKLGNIRATGAQFVVTGNPGCLMQIGAGLARSGSSARVVHPIDLLDASYAAGTDSAAQ